MNLLDGAGGGALNGSAVSGGDSWSLQGYVDRSNGGGTSRASRFRADSAGPDAALTLNQMWSLPVGARLGTSTSVERIGGVVFLDANNNGHADAGESGAPNVTVVLDGRFSVQTDVNGRFVFPVVVTGHHLITVVADNLPLPWALLNEGRTPVEVSTRNRTQVDIAAQRPR